MKVKFNSFKIKFADGSLSEKECYNERDIFMWMLENKININTSKIVYGSEINNMIEINITSDLKLKYMCVRLQDLTFITNKPLSENAEEKINLLNMMGEIMGINYKKKEDLNKKLLGLKTIAKEKKKYFKVKYIYEEDGEDFLPYKYSTVKSALRGLIVAELNLSEYIIGEFNSKDEFVRFCKLNDKVLFDLVKSYDGEISHEYIQQIIEELKK